MYKQNLALKNQQQLICKKTQPNQTKLRSEMVNVRHRSKRVRTLVALRLLLNLYPGQKYTLSLLHIISPPALD